MQHAGAASLRCSERPSRQTGDKQRAPRLQRPAILKVHSGFSVFARV
ncbi:MAG: hypothetical protein MZV70_29640 [Desulfobacterales bacterium]|nr:hypothetical protein [Desulfobacterales bacterium]